MVGFEHGLVLNLLTDLIIIAFNVISKYWKLKFYGLKYIINLIVSKDVFYCNFAVCAFLNVHESEHIYVCVCNCVCMWTVFMTACTCVHVY